MNTQPTLTPAALDAQLMQPAGAVPPEAAALRSTLADLRASSLAAADFRLPAPRPEARPVRSPLFPRWAMVTATAAMAVALAVPVALHTAHSATSMPAATAAAAPQATADSAVQDDVLLADIQNDLSTSVPASLEPLATSSTSSSSK